MAKDAGKPYRSALVRARVKDPDATLAAIRDYVQRLPITGTLSVGEVTTLVHLVDSLDEWLTNGGMFPRAWWGYETEEHEDTTQAVRAEDPWETAKATRGVEELEDEPLKTHVGVTGHRHTWEELRQCSECSRLSKEEASQYKAAVQKFEEGS